MNSVTCVQILNKVICISHNIKTLGKGINPTILPSTIVEPPGYFNLDMETGLVEGELWI